MDVKEVVTKIIAVETPREVDVDIPTPLTDPETELRSERPIENEVQPDTSETPTTDTPKTYPRLERKAVDRLEPKW